MENEFMTFERERLWPQVFTLIQSESRSCFFSKDIGTAHHNLNRYIDVTPYDRNRVKLKRIDDDYINASHIEVPEASRKYILTQGPLYSTISHFWLMVWEQNSRTIVMLNRLIENEMNKCHQYWPEGKNSELTLSDVQLVVKFKSSKLFRNHIIRDLVLTDEVSGESRTIKQFHFTAWPDFGQPDSPLSFLRLLNAVKSSGGLEKYGPAIIHCSAGIGRSGTFCLIDSVLVMIEKTGSTSGIDIRKILVSMREYRMGLIQTPEQLRFSYMAILTAANQLRSLPLGDDLSETVLDDETESSPLINDVKSSVDSDNQPNQTMAITTAGSTVLLQRKRERDLRNQRIAEKTKRIQETMKLHEANREKWKFPQVPKVGLVTCGVAVFVCLYYLAFNASR
ncbi:Tyrosine-protein phosphatase non-receptor type 2, partial [Fragariocoptes setiger]